MNKRSNLQHLTVVSPLVNRINYRLNTWQLLTRKNIAISKVHSQQQYFVFDFGKSWKNHKKTTFQVLRKSVVGDGKVQSWPGQNFKCHFNVFLFKGMQQRCRYIKVMFCLCMKCLKKNRCDTSTLDFSPACYTLFQRYWMRLSNELKLTVFPFKLLPDFLIEILTQKSTSSDKDFFNSFMKF